LSFYEELINGYHARVPFRWSWKEGWKISISLMPFFANLTNQYRLNQTEFLLFLHYPDIILQLFLQALLIQLLFASLIPIAMACFLFVTLPFSPFLPDFKVLP